MLSLSIGTLALLPSTSGFRLAGRPGHGCWARARAVRAVATDPRAEKTFTGRPGGDFEVLDVEAMRAASTFPIAPDDLIFRCQEVLAANVGTKDPDMLADDFEFAGPVVGPINKEQYLKAVEAALDNIYDAFPELKAQYYDFRVDPFEPNRVWYTSRGYGQMTGSFAGGAIKPNGRFIQQPPQTGSMSFNERGQAVEATNGYVMDRRVGSTGGLGAVYAILYHMGIPVPFPEAQPWTPSPQFRLALEGAWLADRLVALFGKPTAAPNPYWRRSAEEVNSKPDSFHKKWAVEPVYKKV